MSNPCRCSVALPWGQHPLYSLFLVSAHMRDSDDNMMSLCSVRDGTVENATNKVKSYYIMRAWMNIIVFFFVYCFLCIPNLRGCVLCGNVRVRHNGLLDQVTDLFGMCKNSHNFGWRGRKKKELTINGSLGKIKTNYIKPVIWLEWDNWMIYYADIIYFIYYLYYYHRNSNIKKNVWVILKLELVGYVEYFLDQGQVKCFCEIL